VNVLDLFSGIGRAIMSVSARSRSAVRVCTSSDDYDASDDFARSIDEAYRIIRERKANGGKGWGGWE
jgi:hypothetical protein